MDPSKLTDYQLYEINQNFQIDKDIRIVANNELHNRKLTNDDIRELAQRHDNQFKPLPNHSLETKYKILLILFPFFLPVPIQAIIAIKYLVRGQKRKWKDYWLYISLGYLLWTFGIILFFRFFLFTTKIS